MYKRLEAVIISDLEPYIFLAYSAIVDWLLWKFCYNCYKSNNWLQHHLVEQIFLLLIHRKDM